VIEINSRLVPRNNACFDRGLVDELHVASWYWWFVVGLPSPVQLDEESRRVFVGSGQTILLPYGTKMPEGAVIELVVTDATLPITVIDPNYPTYWLTFTRTIWRRRSMKFMWTTGGYWIGLGPYYYVDGSAVFSSTGNPYVDVSLPLIAPGLSPHFTAPYDVQISPILTADAAGGVSVCSTNQTASGFRLRASAAFTGRVEWQIQY